MDTRMLALTSKKFTFVLHSDLKKMEEEWIQAQIRGVLTKPHFFREDVLVIAEEDKDKVYKRLKDRLWTDRDGQVRLWFYKIRTYRTEEEFVWMKIL